MGTGVGSAGLLWASGDPDDASDAENCGDTGGPGDGTRASCGY